MQFVNHFPAKNESVKSFFSKKSIAKRPQKVYNKRTVYDRASPQHAVGGSRLLVKVRKETN